MTIPKLLIFDFDGVIVNTEDIFLHKIHEELLALRFNISFAEACKRFSGYDTYDALIDLLKDYPSHHTAEEIFEVLNKGRPSWLNEISAMPYLQNLLDYLIKVNIPYCIASNSDRSHITKSLAVIELQSYFKDEIIFSAHELNKPKPNPAVYLHALKVMDCKAEDALVVEDSVPGVTAACAANLKVLGFTSSSLIDKAVHKQKLLDIGAYAVIDSLKEVLDYLK